MNQTAINIHENWKDCCELLTPENTDVGGKKEIKKFRELSQNFDLLFQWQLFTVVETSVLKFELGSVTL